MSAFIKGLQDRVSLQAMCETIELASDQQLRDIAIEIHRQSINRAAIARNILNQREDGLSPSDLLALRIYPLEIDKLSSQQVREEAIAKYEQLLREHRNFQQTMAGFLRIEGEY